MYTYINVLQRTNDGELADRYYGVSYDWTITDEEHPEQEGITHMRIELLNTDKVIEIGQ